MDLLTPDSYIPLNLRYGFDSPENTGRTDAEVGKLLPRQNTGTGSVLHERARQRVTKAERQLRHPARAKYYKDLLPSFTSQS